MLPSENNLEKTAPALILGRARWYPGRKKSSATWLTLLSVSIVCQDFFTLALTARYNEFQAAQRRLLRYISLRSLMFLWHKNTTYWDSAIHLARFSSDILFSDQTALLKMILTAILWTTMLYGLIGGKRTLPTRLLCKCKCLFRSLCIHGTDV